MDDGGGKTHCAKSAAADPQAEAAVAERRKMNICQMYDRPRPRRSSLQPAAALVRPSHSAIRRSPSSSVVALDVPPKVGGAGVVTSPSVTDSDPQARATLSPPPTYPESSDDADGGS